MGQGMEIPGANLVTLKSPEQFQALPSPSYCTSPTFFQFQWNQLGCVSTMNIEMRCCLRVAWDCTGILPCDILGDQELTLDFPIPSLLSPEHLLLDLCFKRKLVATFTVIVSALENDNDPNLLEAFCKVNKVAFGLFLMSVVLSSLFAFPMTQIISSFCVQLPALLGLEPG